MNNMYAYTCISVVWSERNYSGMYNWKLFYWTICLNKLFVIVIFIVIKEKQLIVSLFHCDWCFFVNCFTASLYFCYTVELFLAQQHELEIRKHLTKLTTMSVQWSTNSLQCLWSKWFYFCIRFLTNDVLSETIWKSILLFIFLQHFVQNTSAILSGQCWQYWSFNQRMDSGIVPLQCTNPQWTELITVYYQYLHYKRTLVNYREGVIVAGKIIVVWCQNTTAIILL